MYANVFFDKKNFTYYLEPSNTGTSLKIAGEINMPAGKDLVMGGLNMLSSDGTSNYLKTGVNLYLENQASTIGVLTGTGRLGLGTTNPDSRLHIVSEEIGTGANKGFRISNHDESKEYSIRTGISGANNTTLAIYDETSALNRLVIDSAGDIGIGVTDPLAKLHVNGEI
jgi:hypothetical protein